MNFDYIKVLRWWLRTIDAWPSKVLGERVRVRWFFHHKFLFVFWCCSLLSQIEYVRRNFNGISVFDLGRCCITILTTAVCCQRVIVVMMKSYQNMTKEFVEKMHMFHHRNSSDFAFKIYKVVEKYCRLATIILQLQMMVAPLMYNMTPILSNLFSGMFSNDRPINGTYKQSTYYALPFDYTTNLLNYIIVVIANIILCYWVAITVCMYDLYLTVLMCHIWGHLTILDHEIRHVMRPTAGNYAWFTPEESKTVAEQLKMLINYHRQIKQFVERCSSAFGPTLAIYFTYHQICCCILLLECSKLDTESLSEFGPVTMIVFQQLMQISIFIEIVGKKSEGLADSLYSMPWECMGVRERRLVLIVLQNAQNPIHIKALGLVPIGLQTMVAILKTSLSYYVMLQTLTNDNK